MGKFGSLDGDAIGNSADLSLRNGKLHTGDKLLVLGSMSGYSPDKGEPVWIINHINDTAAEAVARAGGRWFSYLTTPLGNREELNGNLRPRVTFYKGDTVYFWSNKQDDNHRYDGHIGVVKSVYVGVVLLEDGLSFREHTLLKVKEAAGYDESKLLVGAYVDLEEFEDEYALYLGKIDGEYTFYLSDEDVKIKKGSGYTITDYNVFEHNETRRADNVAEALYLMTKSGSVEETLAGVLRDLINV